MTKSVPIVIAALLALAAAGGAVYGLSAGAAPSAAPATAPSPARAGRPLSLEDAIRELNLVKPSRQKYAEDFTLKMAEGGTFRLADQRGKVVLVNFWATWCPPCREEMPAMQRLYDRHKARGLVLVAVSLDADPALVPPYVKASKLTFPIALDPKAEVGNKYGVRALPSSFVVDKQGVMIALALGPRVWDNDASHALVDALLK